MTLADTRWVRPFFRPWVRSQWLKAATLGLLLLAAIVPASDADANHRHWRPRVGVYIGGPIWWGSPFYHPNPYWYAPPPVYYSSPPVVYSSPPAPTVYVEQTPAASAPAPQAAAPAANFWYFCRDPEGYYPYVKECKSQWEPVAPQPAKP